MSTVPDDHTFLASANRHKRKQKPARSSFNIQTLLIAVALALIAASFLLGNKDETSKITRVEISTQNSTIESIASLTELPASLLEGERARELIKGILHDGNQPLESIFLEAEKLRSSQQYIDAWLVHFYAARLGHGPSSAALAAMSDPATYKGFGSPLPDASEFQALKWYSLASQQGATKVKDDFERLKSSIRTNAKSGDSHSKQLLLQLDNF